MVQHLARLIKQSSWVARPSEESSIAKCDFELWDIALLKIQFDLASHAGVAAAVEEAADAQK